MSGPNAAAAGTSPAQRLGIGEIGEHHARLPARADDFAGELFGLGARAVGVQHDGVAGLRQRERDGAADAAPRPGDQRRARQLLCRSSRLTPALVIRQSTFRRYPVFCREEYQCTGPYSNVFAGRTWSILDDEQRSSNSSLGLTSRVY